MAWICEICGKRPSSGHNVSHSKRRTKRRWLPNLQHKRLTIGDVTRHVRVCTRCLRTLTKASA
ncbi:MAG: 50S ribosomal protein L28 [Chloroflexi bacterium]|nr:50S ribosomal protein L28 [Chloroflexota bacterium]MBI4506296.1 50S ribosomal protein L28 [Chloroflexota bacterium]